MGSERRPTAPHEKPEARASFRPVRPERVIRKLCASAAAQGNATRLFFRDEDREWTDGWKVFHEEAFSCFGYLLSGGYSKPALYPGRWLRHWAALDRALSHWPMTGAGRCPVSLIKESGAR